MLTRKTCGLVFAVFVLAGCDVTNPGPIQDEFLTDPESHVPMVRGAGRTLTGPMGTFVQDGGVLSREVFPGGQTGAGAFSREVQKGAISWDQSGGPWGSLHSARFIAEYALEIFAQPSVEAAPAVITDAHLFAGIAHRLLGDYFCQVAYDGGGLEDPSVALERAEEHFSAALETAATDAQRHAAYAGRAQTRLSLGNWSGAQSDASQVPLSFRQTLPTGALAGERNAFAYGSNSSPHRSQTVRFTFYDSYYPATGDPRVAWETYPNNPFCTANLLGYGSVPCTRPKTKHRNLTDPLLISSGAEMLLIRAEAILMQNPASWPEALDLINQVRTRIMKEGTTEPLAPWTATSNAETWTVLMRERGIELWLDGKRLADLRRWEENNVPGDPALPDETQLGTHVSSYNPNDTCYPVPLSEVNENPNINPSDVIKSRDDV